MITAVTRRDLEAIFGATRGEIQGWERDPKFPPPTRSGKGRAKAYDLPRVVAWVLARAEAEGYERGHEEASVDPANADDQRWRKERAAKVAAERAKLERENALAEGRMILAEVHAQALNELFAVLVQDLEALPSRSAEPVAAESDPAKIRYLLLAEVRRTRNRLGETIRKWVAEKRREEGVE